jgi:hypothetical protein
MLRVVIPNASSAHVGAQLSVCQLILRAVRGT